MEDFQGPEAAVNQDGEKGCQLCSRIASGLNVLPRRLGRSLAAASLDSLFDHPVKGTGIFLVKQVLEA
ncbi:MAG: hypothetical protein EPO64_03550 [Nitrospirae bacterium]|nr:MAG: hypothetical protein EPO64_03550 [Nitrospirota bacterium]